MSFKNNEETKRSQKCKVLDKIKLNGHVYIEGDYETKNSSLKVACPAHNTVVDTTFTNYFRSKTGLRCCGKSRVSNILTGRIYSPETIKQMSDSAKKRKKKGRTQDRRRTSEYRQWEKETRLLWNTRCAITGAQQKNSAQLCLHHFYSGKRGSVVDNHQLLMYEPLNGICLTKQFHENFHKRFSYQRNTLTQFQKYLQEILQLISSQAEPESSDGSETKSIARATREFYVLLRYSCLDPLKIKKLLKRLEEIKERLIEKYPNLDFSE